MKPTNEDYKDAAKAAGFKISIHPDIDFAKDEDYPILKSTLDYWMPVDDDGDSRRLQVACCIQLQIDDVFITARAKDITIRLARTKTRTGEEVARIAVFLVAVELGKKKCLT
jgi:hypothetical protein